MSNVTVVGGGLAALAAASGVARSSQLPVRMVAKTFGAASAHYPSPCLFSEGGTEVGPATRAFFDKMSAKPASCVRRTRRVCKSADGMLLDRRVVWVVDYVGLSHYFDALCRENCVVMEAASEYTPSDGGSEIVIDCRATTDEPSFETLAVMARLPRGALIDPVEVVLPTGASLFVVPRPLSGKSKNVIADCWLWTHSSSAYDDPDSLWELAVQHVPELRATGVVRVGDYVFDEYQYRFAGDCFIREFHADTPADALPFRDTGRAAVGRVADAVDILSDAVAFRAKRASRK